MGVSNKSRMGSGVQRNTDNYSWETAYVFWDLMDAQKANRDPSMIQKMDSWNAEADTLGFMLTLATAMV
jgi:hypothetical protein